MRNAQKKLQRCLLAGAIALTGLQCSQFPAQKVPKHTRIHAIGSGTTIWSFEKAVISRNNQIGETKIHDFLDMNEAGTCLVKFAGGKAILIKNGKLVIDIEHSETIQAKKVLNYLVDGQKIIPDTYIRTFR